MVALKESRPGKKSSMITRALVGLKVPEAEISLASPVPTIGTRRQTDSQAAKHVQHSRSNVSNSRVLNVHSGFESMGNANLRCTFGSPG